MTIDVTLDGGLLGSTTVDGQADVGTMTATGETISEVQGTSFSDVELATFTDNQTGYSGYSASDYTATTDFGDGTSSNDTITAISGESGSYEVTGSDTFLGAGDLSPTVTITGPNGQSATATDTADVEGLGVTGNDIVAGQNISYDDQPVATFADTKPGISGVTYTASIDWNDGSDPTTGMVSTIDGVLTVSGTHTYASAGDFSPTVTVDSSDGRTASGLGDAQVSGITVNEDDLSISSGDATTGLLADLHRHRGGCGQRDVLQLHGNH